MVLNPWSSSVRVSSTRMCATSRGTAISSNEMLSTGTLVIAALRIIDLRATTIGSKKDWNCSGTKSMMILGVASRTRKRGSNRRNRQGGE
jgi:hypothetical protein